MINGNNSKENLPLRQISAAISMVAFVADLLTVGLFIRDLFWLDNRLTLGSALAQIALIVCIFVFALLLFAYSQQENTGLERIVSIFAWFYICFAAAIFSIVSYRFVTYADYSFGEFIAYPLLIALITALGYGAMLVVKGITAYLSIPFMLVALGQVVFWILRIYSGESLSFSWTFVGNLLLFAFAGLLIILLMLPTEEVEEVSEKSPKVQNNTPVIRSSNAFIRNIEPIIPKRRRAKRK